MTGRIQLRFLQLTKEARENITSAQFDAILILNAILCIACKRKPQSTIRWNEILKRNEQWVYKNIYLDNFFKLLDGSLRYVWCLNVFLYSDISILDVHFKEQNCFWTNHYNITNLLRHNLEEMSISYLHKTFEQQCMSCIKCNSKIFQKWDVIVSYKNIFN